MGLQHILNQGQQDWLLQTGDIHTYLSVKTGRLTQIQATTEVEVEVIDNDGMMVKHPLAFMASDAVPEVTLGDMLTNTVTGEKWSIQEKYEDNGTFMSLYLQREN